MLKKILIIGGAIAAAGGGIFLYYRNQLEKLKGFKYQLLSFNLVNKATTSEVTVNVGLRITSDSTIDANVKDLSLDIFIDNEKIGRVEDTRPFVIPAKGYSDVFLTLTVSPKLIAGTAVKVLTSFLGSQDFAINLRGFVRVQSSFIKVSVPFAYDTTFKQIKAKP